MKEDAAFTLVEVMIAASLTLLVTLAMLTSFVMMNKITYAGNQQVRYNDMARMAQNKIIKYIEGSRACGLQSATCLILTRPTANGLVQGSLSFVDADNNLATVSNNCIVYDPNTSVSGDTEVICSYVSFPIIGTNSSGATLYGTNMFQMLNISPATVGVMFHIGDATNTPGAGLLRTGYQGVEESFSATPRNLQSWFNF